MNMETGKCMGGKDALEFFQSLGSILDDLEIYDSVDEDFSDKYNMALNRFKYLAKKDISVKPKYIKKVKGRGIYAVNCGACGYKLSEVGRRFCPNCSQRIDW